MRKPVLVGTAVILVLGLAAVAMAGDPFVGTWKMNPAKTKVVGPGSAFKSCTIKIEAQENGIKITCNLVDAVGKAVHGEFAAKYDGKDYPITDPDSDTLALKRIGVHTLVYLFKKGGNDAGSWRSVISGDGKTLTFTVKDKNPKGQDFIHVDVYEKQ